jgi:hypothetical protein
MAIASTDIRFYGAASMAEADTDPTGGAIDRTVKVVFDAVLAANDTLDIVSSNAGDTTQTATVTGRLASGVITTEAFTLNGTTQQLGATTFERILKVVVDGTYLGTLTIEENSGSTTVATMDGSGVAPGGVAELELRRMFYSATAAASGGSDKNLYEKFFIANTHASLALTSAAVELTTDGTAGDIIDFDLEDAINDTNSETNRITDPVAGNLGAWNDTQKSVPGGILGDRTTSVADEIGVWMRMDLNAGTAPDKATVEFTVTGATT